MAGGGNINIGVDLGLSNSIIDDINEEMQGLRKELEGKEFAIPVEFGEGFEKEFKKLTKQVEKADKSLEQLRKNAEKLADIDVEFIDNKKLKEVERDFGNLLKVMQKQAKDLGANFASAMEKGNFEGAAQILKVMGKQFDKLNEGSKKAAKDIEAVGEAARESAAMSEKASKESANAAKEVTEAIKETGQASKQAAKEAEKHGKAVKEASSKSGGGGDGEKPPAETNLDKYKAFQEELDKAVANLRKSSMGWSGAFDQTLQILRRGMEETAGEIEDGSAAIRGAVETFSKYATDNFRREVDNYGATIQMLMQWRGRLKQALEAENKAHKLSTVDEEKLVAAVRQITASLTQMEAAQAIVIEGEKVRTRVMDSARQVTSLQEKANLALAESWEPHRMRAVIREYHGLEQVITHSTRMVQKYMNQLNGVDQALEEVQESLQIRMPQITDPEELAAAKAQLSIVENLRLAVKERRQEGQRELVQLAQQRQMATGTLDVLKDQVRSQQAAGKLLTKYRSDAERHMLAVRRAAGVAEDVARDVQSGSWNTEEARHIVQHLTNLEKTARVKAEGVTLALREELHRIKQEFEDGVGAFARAKGTMPTQANQEHYDSMVATLNRELDEAKKDAVELRQLLDRIAEDKRIIQLAVNEDDVVKRVSKAVDKVEKEVRTVKRLTLDVDFKTPDPNDLEGHFNALQKVDSVVKNTSKSIPLLVSEIKELMEQGGNQAVLKPLLQRLEATAEAGREVRASLAGIDRGLTAAVVKAQKELGDTIEEATLALDRQANRMVHLSGELKKGGTATMTAVRGFSVMRRELRSQEEALQKEVDGILQVERALGSLSSEQQRQLLQLRMLLEANREMGRTLDQNKTHIDRQGRSAEKTGQRFRLWNAAVMDSIKHQFKFFNAMSVVMSTLFLIRTAIHELIEESKSFSRTLTVLQSDTLSLQESFEQFKNAARQAAVEFGLAIGEVSEMVKQFGSAGLTTEEALAGMDAGLRLLISTQADAEQVGRQVAALYRVFGRNMGEATDLTYGFARITDVLTAVYRNNQAELDEMVQGLSFAAATGKLAGFEFEEISGFLAVLNDNLIKSGNAGRGLQVVLAQFASKRQQFEKAFDIQLDPNATIASQFITALEAARKSMGGTEVNLRALEGIFAKFGLRGARSFAVLAQEVDVVRENIERLYDSEGTASLLADLVKNELASSFERAKQAMLELLREAVEPMQKAFILFSDAVIQFKQGFDALPNWVKGLGGLVIVGAGLAYVLSGAIAMLNLFAAGIQFAVGSVVGLTKALRGNSAQMGANSAQAKELAVSQTLLGQSAQGATARLVSATKAVGGVTAAISGLLVLLPVILFGIGAMTKSVADMRREMAALDAKELELKEARQGLAAFEKAWEQALKRAADSSKSLEIRGNALRSTLLNQGKAYIDLGITAGRTNAELVQSTGRVNEQVVRQIQLQRELQKIRQEAVEAELRAGARGTIEQKYGTAIPNLWDDETVNLWKRFQDSQRISGGMGIYGEHTFWEMLAASLFGPAALYQFSKDVEDEYYQVLNETQSGQAAIEAATRKHNVVITTLLGELNSDLAAAGMGDVLSEASEAFLTRVLSQRFSISKKEAKEAVRYFQKMYQSQLREASSNIKVESIDGLEALNAELLELQKTFDAALSEETFAAFIGMSDRYVSELETRVRGLKLAFIELGNLQSSQQGIQMPFDVNPQNLMNLFDQALNAMDSDGVKNLIKDLGITLGEEFSKEGAKRLADNLTEDELKTMYVGLSKGSQQLTDAVHNQMRLKLVKALTDRSVTGAAQDMGLNITRQLLDPKNFEAVLAAIEKHTNFAGTSAWDKFQKGLAQLEKNDFFRLFSLQFSGMMIDSFKDRFDTKTIANSFAQMNAELVRSQQELGHVDNQLAKILGDQSAQVWMAQKLNEAYEPIIASMEEQGEVTQEMREAAFEQAKAQFQNGEEGKNFTELMKRQLEVSVQLKNQMRAIAIETQNRRQAQAQIALQAALESKENRSTLGQHMNERKLLRRKINDQARILALQEELYGSTLETLAAQNELEEGRQGLIRSLREELQILNELEASHFAITAQAEQLIYPLSQTAGLYSEFLGVVSQLNVLNKERERISKREIQTDNDRLEQFAELQHNYGEVVQLADTLFQIEKKLLEEQKKSNETYRARLGLLQQIKSTFGENASEIESQLSSALNAQFDANPILAASAAAAQLGIQFGWALEQGTSLIPQLIAGAKRGEVSFAGFGGEVFRISQQFEGLNTEIGKVDERIKNLANREFESASKAFESAMSRENIEDAQAALDRMADSSAQMYENDRVRFILSREEMLRYYDEFEALRTKQEDGLSIENMLVGITKLREYLKELTTEAYKVRLDVVGDAEELFKVLRGGTIDGLIEPSVTGATHLETFAEKIEDAVFRGMTSAMARFEAFAAAAGGYIPQGAEELTTRVLNAIAQKESGHNVNAFNPQGGGFGANGLLQIRKILADVYRVDARTLMGDAEKSIELFAKHIRDTAEHHMWDPKRMALLWNRGVGTLEGANRALMEGLDWDDAIRKSLGDIYNRRIEKDLASGKLARKDEAEARAKSLEAIEAAIRYTRHTQSLVSNPNFDASRWSFSESDRKILGFDRAVESQTELIQATQDLTKANENLQRAIQEQPPVEVGAGMTPRAMSTGGHLPGFGGGDKIPALLESGEFVIPKESVAKYGVGFFESLRRGSVRGFAGGGLLNSELDGSAYSAVIKGGKQTRTNLDRIASATEKAAEALKKAADKAQAEADDSIVKDVRALVHKAIDTPMPGIGYDKNLGYDISINPTLTGDFIPELSAGLTDTVGDSVAEGLGSRVVQKAIAILSERVGEEIEKAFPGAGGPSDPSKLISEGEQANTQRFGIAELEMMSKEIDKTIEKAFAEAAEKAFKTTKVVNTIVKVFDTASKFFNNAIDLGFINEGAKAVRDAIATYREAIRTAADGFQTSVASAEDTLRNNSASIYSYIDSIQQAEKAYYDQRIQAARELNKTLKETQDLFRTALADGVTKAFDNIKVSLDAVTPSMERLIKAGNILAQGAEVGGKIRLQALSGMEQAEAGALSAAKNLGKARAGGDAVEIAAAAKAFEVAQKRHEESVVAFAMTGDKLRDLFLKEAATLIGGALLNILNAGFSAIIGPMISTMAKALEPGGLREYVKSMTLFLDQLIANAPRIIDEILREMPRLIEALASRIPEIVQLFAEAIPEIVRVIAETAVPALAKALPEIINSIGAALPDLIRVMIPAVVDMALAVINSIPEIVHHLAAALPVLIGEVIKAAPRIILSLLTLPFELITGLITGFFTTLPEVLFDVITSLPKLIVEGFKTVIQQFIDSIARFFGKATEDQKEARKQLKELGYSWIERQALRANPMLRSNMSEDQLALFRAAYPKAGFRHGGRIPGFGGGDIFPAMLEPGEYVIPKETVRALGTPYFDRLRKVDSLPAFRHGGPVTPIRAISATQGSSASPTNISMNATVNVSGSSTRAERRKAARETVAMLDSELAKLKRNRNSKSFRD